MLGGVAVMDSGSGLISEVRLNVKTTHSERLMTAVDYALGQSDLSIKDMDAFAVACGPGSFTGLRIGLSTGKGLAFATGKPLVAVPTLESFAWNFPCSRYPVCLMLDARKGEVYTAVFTWDGNGFERLIPETSLAPEALLGHLPQAAILFAGEAAVAYRSVIAGRMGDRAVFAPAEKMVPSPAAVAALGMRKALRGDYVEPAAAVPTYYRKSEAEIKWREK